MELIDQFESILSKLNGLKEPQTSGELAEQLALVTEAIEKCEKLLIYMATSPSHKEDSLTYLFEYKQLINLERRLSEVKIEEKANAAVSPARAWWKFWK